MLIENRLRDDCGDPLLLSLINDDLESFKNIINQKKEGNFNGCVDNPPFSFFTLFDIKFPYISAAAILNSIKIFRFLYDSGISLASTSESGATVIQSAALNPCPEILEILQKENVDYEEGAATFVRCFNFDRFTKYKDLFLTDKSLFTMSPTKSTPLVQSVMCNNFLVFKYCIEKNVDINQSDGFNATPLSIACQAGTFILVKVLVELGADLKKNTPLVFAAACGHSEIVKYLLTIPEIDVNISMDNEMTPLRAAITNSHGQTVDLLLNYPKTNLEMLFKNGKSYINYAAEQNDVSILKNVIEKVSKKIPLKSHAVSPLLSSIMADMTDSTKFLLSLDEIDYYKIIQNHDISALWMAVKFSQYEIASLLVKEKHVKVTANEIDLARSNNDEKMIKLLTS